MVPQLLQDGRQGRRRRCQVGKLVEDEQEGFPSRPVGEVAEEALPGWEGDTLLKRRVLEVIADDAREANKLLGLGTPRGLLVNAAVHACEAGQDEALPHAPSPDDEQPTGERGELGPVGLLLGGVGCAREADGDLELDRVGVLELVEQQPAVPAVELAAHGRALRAGRGDVGCTIETGRYLGGRRLRLLRGLVGTARLTVLAEVAKERA